MSRRSHRPDLLGSTAALAAGLLLAGCSAAPRPVAAPPAPPKEAPAPASPVAAEPSKLPPKTVVVRPSQPSGQGSGTLAEAAAAEHQRREALERRSSVVINDKNLAAWAAKGQVTEVRPPADESTATAAPSPAALPAESSATGPPKDEAYWRRQALSIRERWRQAYDAIGALEQRAADLRWQFYAEDDPYYRDSTIKPQWDRALDDLRRSRREVEEARAALDQLLEEGAKAGALPGWLREGVELEPPAEPARREPAAHETIEPPIVDPEGP